MSTYRLDTGIVADWQITQRLGGNCVRIESPSLLTLDGTPTHMIVRLSDLIATGVPSGPVAGGGGQVEAIHAAGALPAAIVPAARATDPATSHEAAATITVQRMRADHQLVLAALHDHGPMTDFGIAAKVSAALGRMVKATSLGVRRKELVTLGLVRNSGRRAPSDTGTSSIVWALTAAGDAEIRGVA